MVVIILVRALVPDPRILESIDHINIVSCLKYKVHYYLTIIDL